MAFAATRKDLEIITLSEVRQWTQTSCATTYMQNLKKKRMQMDLFAKPKQTHRLGKTYGYQKGHVGEGRGGLGVWDGNVLKLGCDDGCTTINIIKFIELKK